MNVESSPSWRQWLALLVIATAIGAIAGELLASSRAGSGWSWLHWCCKPLATLLIFMLAWRARPPVSPRYRRWILIGIALSCGGDVFLMLPMDLFVPGLLAFLLAHLCFLKAFLGDTRFAACRLPMLVTVAYGAINVSLLWPSIDAPLRAPVIVYVTALACMAGQAVARARVLAMDRDTRAVSAMRAAVGALLFMLSDSVLAWNRFRGPLPFAEATAIYQLRIQHADVPAGFRRRAGDVLSGDVVDCALGMARRRAERGRRGGMNTQELIITWATPVFFLLIGIELLVAKLRGRATYASSDAISSIGLGVISQIVGVFSKLLTFGIYAWCVDHLALFALPADNLMTWAGALLLYDLCYYWLHRCGHRVNILWAAHVVHHQSEHYNLSTALRQTGSGVLLSWIFYLPLALLGVPLQVFVIVALIDLLYQFWVHTEQIGRLGWFDRVFCSPSNHRAHHAVNDRYLDRNYGGILIVWDRLFGTFVEEDDSDAPVYGTRLPLRSWNPLWANVEVYWSTAINVWHARRWRDKLLLWIKPPGWCPPDVAERFPKPAFVISSERFNPPLSKPMTIYALVQFALLLGMATQFLGMAGNAGLGTLLAYAAYLVISLCILGGLMEARRWVVWLEVMRAMMTAIVPWISGRWFGVDSLDHRVVAAFAATFGISAFALFWIHSIRRQHLPVTVSH